jgi:hypothetical protein
MAKKAPKHRSFEAMALRFHVPKVIPDKRRKMTEKRIMKEIKNG